ncbi:hypothetical protein EVG20_g5758 [Dentipellis fragilis]|uniref:Fungal-type protein kinase domain-containing protein n=1 Tax=Dentipellis fragilis TaxID=205917 RepID=A0A4Y9YRB1_9AGAM|nr:hypothetical protein EVG20_g5758 [Dentipellis fragilis]
MAPKPRKGSSRASVDRGPAIPPSGERLIRPIPRRRDSNAHVGDGVVGSSSAIPSASVPAPSTTEAPAVTEDSTSAAGIADAPPRDGVAPTRSQLNTMVSDKLATHVGFSSGTRPLDFVKDKICAEACGAFVGPMKARDFLDAFVPPPSAQEGEQRVMPDVSFAEMSKATNEIQMYDPYLKICQQLDQDHIMRYYDTHSTNDSRTVPPDAPAREGLSPDVMTFHKDRLPEGKAVTNFSLRREGRRVQVQDQPGKDTRGQITAYAAAMLELQFRTFVFSVLIMGDFARLIRWDRSGAIVTEAFNYQVDPEPLAQFLWRYNFLSRAQRGFDESVKAIEATDNTPDLSEARKALKEYIPPNTGEHSDLYLLRMIPLDMSSSPPNKPLPRSDHTSASPDEPSSPSDEPDLSAKHYHAHESKSSDGWDYYVTAPHMSDRGPFGRMTRSLYVFNRITKTVHHLKDTNRIVSPMHSVEHEIINELAEKEVRHVSTVRAAWDVAPEGKCYDTVTPSFCDDKWIDPRFTPLEVGWFQAGRVYRAYRLVTNELGTPIWMFKNWEEVMRVMIDIFQALDDAEKAGWRHRDVSSGNIMICGGHGLLIDWDASQRSKDMNKENQKRVPDLTGTWQFMSLRRLRNVGGRHDAADDLESVFWVLLWLALNYSVHSLAPEELKDFLHSIFDQRNVVRGCYTGGAGKDALLEKKYLNGFIPTPFSPDGLQKVLESLHDTFRLRPPPELQIPIGMNEKRAQIERVIYQNTLAVYELEKEKLNDSTHVRQLLKDALDMYTWPMHGPVVHVIPADHNGSQMTQRLLNSLAAGVRPPNVARRSSSLSNGPTLTAAGRAKMMRLGMSSDSKSVTHYATVNERDEEGQGQGNDT